jgi:hypothetical protein
MYEHKTKKNKRYWRGKNGLRNNTS